MSADTAASLGPGLADLGWAGPHFCAELVGRLEDWLFRMASLTCKVGWWEAGVIGYPSLQQASLGLFTWSGPKRTAEACLAFETGTLSHSTGQ